jgi:hypothetical protein
MTTSSPPDALFGILQPGERTTRMFSRELDSEHAAILQRAPGSGLRIAEQASTEITLENTGDKPSPYIVLFPTKAFVRAAAGAKELVGFIAGLRGKR